MPKYYIESMDKERLKADLTFRDGYDNLMLLETLEEAEERMVMYGCVNCSVKHMGSGAER